MAVIVLGFLYLFVLLAKSSDEERGECSKVSGVLAPLAGDGCTESLGKTCALVGGSSSMHDSGLGNEIEKHKTIIRINRLPHPRHYRDLGQRTDVYFVNSLNKYRVSASKLEWEVGVKPHFIWCKHALNCSCPSCPKHIVFEGAPLDTFWRVGKQLRGRAALNAAKAAAKSVDDPSKQFITKKVSSASGHHTTCRQSHALHFFEHNIPAVPYGFNQAVDRHFRDAVAPWAYKSKPSGGLKAFLTFVMLCDSISLFGFSGSKSIDGHPEVGHNFKAEHLFYDKLVRAGQKRRKKGDDNDLTSLFAPSFRNHSMKTPFSQFAERVICLARHGRISLVI